MCPIFYWYHDLQAVFIIIWGFLLLFMWNKDHLIAALNTPMCILHDLLLALNRENIACSRRKLYHPYSLRDRTLNPITVTVDQVTTGLFHYTISSMNEAYECVFNLYAVNVYTHSCSTMLVWRSVRIIRGDPFVWVNWSENSFNHHARLIFSKWSFRMVPVWLVFSKGTYRLKCFTHLRRLHVCSFYMQISMTGSCNENGTVHN